VRSGEPQRAHREARGEDVEQIGGDARRHRDCRAVFPERHEVQRDDHSPPRVDDQLHVAELLRFVARCDAPDHPPPEHADRQARCEEQERRSERRPEVADRPPQQRIHVLHVVDTHLDPVVEERERDAHEHHQREHERHHVADARASGQEHEDERRQRIQHERDREKVGVHRERGVQRTAADHPGDRRNTDGQRGACDPYDDERE
jgi:hypothetical protein